MNRPVAYSSNARHTSGVRRRAHVSEIETFDAVLGPEVLQMESRAARHIEQRGRGGMDPCSKPGKARGFTSVVVLRVSNVELYRAVPRCAGTAWCERFAQCIAGGMQGRTLSALPTAARHLSVRTLGMPKGVAASCDLRDPVLEDSVASLEGQRQELIE